MEKKLIILTNSFDGVNSQSVIDNINLLSDCEVFRFDVDKLKLGSLVLNLLINDSREDIRINNAVGQTCTMDQIGSAWYRRPNYFGPTKINEESTVDKSINREILAVQDSIIDKIPIKTWLNDPSEMRKINSKIAQLELAKDIGFKIPDTIISNDVAIFREFLEEHRQIIIKPLKEFMYYENGEYKSLFSTIISVENFSDYDLIKNSPVLLQDYIHKQFEYRVTVVENNIYPVKIFSNGISNDDWRKHQFSNNIEFKTAENIEPELNNKCLEFLSRCNLKYGVFDIIKNKEDELVFLEMNSNGQWYWLENLLGIPVSQSIAKSLIAIFNDNAR